MSSALTTSDKALLVGLPREFSLLDEEMRDELARSGRLLSPPRNEVIVPFGDPRPPVLVVRSGLLALLHPGKDEKPVVADFFGTHAVVFPARAGQDASPFEVRSVVGSHVVAWPIEQLSRAILRTPPFALAMLEAMNARATERYFHHARVRSMPLETQLAYLLWSLAEAEDNGGRSLRMKISQDVIASYLGVAREEVSRKKSLLQRAGYLEATEDGMSLAPEVPGLFLPQGGVNTAWSEAVTRRSVP